MSEAQALDFLPATDFVYLKDRMSDALGIGPSLFGLATALATRLNQNERAYQLAKEALAHHLNPVVQHYAHVGLGLAVVKAKERVLVGEGVKGQ